LEIDLTGLVLPERVEEVRLSKDDRAGEFVIEPLERGYGHTLGNSLRRVLLSSLQGTAVWAFRIEGVVHEHQTISGVVEDVHQVIQNLKSLVLVLDDDVDETALEIKVKKSGAVTAGDIETKSGVAVLDPAHHLLTLQEERDFHMELRANKGRGIVMADDHPVPKGSPVDLVRVDAIYNPVRRANFAVRETRVGQRTDFDQLTLLVETDGSLEPGKAISIASELLRQHLAYPLYFGTGGMPDAVSSDGAVEIPEQLQDLLSREIEDLAELSVRSRNSLQKENILTLGDLVQRSEEDMLGIENFGKKSLKEIQDFLAEHDLRFGMRVTQAGDGRTFLLEPESEAASE